MDLRAAARGEMGKQRIDNSFRGKREQVNGRRDVAGFHQQQGRRGVGPGEPRRERIGCRVPGSGDFGRGERHRGGKPDRNLAARERRRNFDAQRGEHESIRIAGEHRSIALHRKKRAAMRLGIIEAVSDLFRANLPREGAAARNEDQRACARMQRPPASRRERPSRRGCRRAWRR